MPKLSKFEIEDYVYGNKYLPAADLRMRSRCIDGRYINSPKTPALALPGADVGALASIYAAANSCGFEVDPDKAFDALVQLIGGVEYFGFHTDARNYKQGNTGSYDLLGTGCGHIRCMVNNKDVYSLTDADLVTLGKQIDFARKNGAAETVLRGDHQEGAVLQIKGGWGVQPQGFYGSERGNIGTQVFVFHSGLVNARHKEWSRLLVERGAVKLDQAQDEEYLYQMISTTAEDHLMETAKRLAKDLPLYEVVFDQSGNFEVESLGFI